MHYMTAEDLGFVLNAMVKRLNPQIENPYASSESIGQAIFIQELLKAGIEECVRQAKENYHADPKA